MRKVFKKMMAGAMTVAMATTLLVGANFKPATVKAEATDVTNDVITPWVVYSAGQITRSNDPDGWPERYYSSFTTSAGETKTDWNANFPNQQYVDGGEETWQTTKTATGFTADIANTGWDGEYEPGKKDAVGDNPYMLNAKMQQVKLKEGHYYTISMDRYLACRPSCRTADFAADYWNLPERLYKPMRMETRWPKRRKPST